MKKKNTKWNIAPGSRRRGAHAREVTREQLVSAIQSFKQHGGLIRTLPPQSEIPRRAVAAYLDTGLENLFDT